METLSSLLPLPLEHQNIPDGFIIPCYPQNIQFLPSIMPDSEHTHPTATSDIVVICLLVSPTSCSTPLPYYTPPPSHPAPLAYKIPYLLTQKTLLLILTNPGITAILSFIPFFWVVGKYHCGFMKYVRQLPCTDI